MAQLFESICAERLASRFQVWNHDPSSSIIASLILFFLNFWYFCIVKSVVVPIFTQQHKDLVVEAITGSGKTLAFVVPILEILMKKNRTERLKKHQVGALIISPTRELAQQTYDVINIFLNSSHMQAESSHLKSILFVGGNNITSDIKEFVNNGAQIVVGTAGRLEDLLTRQNMTTSFRTYFKSLVSFAIFN